jgi:sugar phosphate permease
MDLIDEEDRPEDEPEGSWKVILEVVTNPTVIILSFAYFCLKPVRYAFLNWGPLMVNERLGTDALDSTLITAAFELGGPLGIIAAGYISDRVFDSRRIPVCVDHAPPGGLCLLFLDQFLIAGAVGGMIVLFLIGFNAFGPDALLTGAAAMDFGTRKGAGTAAGMINGMGSLGCDRRREYPRIHRGARWGWDALFYGLAAAAFVAGWRCCPSGTSGRPSQAARPDPYRSTLRETAAREPYSGGGARKEKRPCRFVSPAA